MTSLQLASTKMEDAIESGVPEKDFGTIMPYRLAKRSRTIGLMSWKKSPFS